MGWVLKLPICKWKLKVSPVLKWFLLNLQNELKRKTVMQCFLTTCISRELCLKVVIPITENKNKCCWLLGTVTVHRTDKLLIWCPWFLCSLGNMSKDSYRNSLTLAKEFQTHLCCRMAALIWALFFSSNPRLTAFLRMTHWDDHQYGCMFKCSILSNCLQPHGLLAHLPPLSMEFSRQEY